MAMNPLYRSPIRRIKGKDRYKTARLIAREFEKLRKKIPIPKLKGIKLPKVGLPKLGLPKLKLPQVKLPKLKLPKLGLPKLKMPDILGGIGKFFGGIFNFLKKWWWVIVLIIIAIILLPVLPSLIGVLSSVFGFVISGIKGVTETISKVMKK